jgi:hypothetical protein
VRIRGGRGGGGGGAALTLLLSVIDSEIHARAVRARADREGYVPSTETLGEAIGNMLRFGSPAEPVPLEERVSIAVWRARIRRETEGARTYLFSWEVPVMGPMPGTERMLHLRVRYTRDQPRRDGSPPQATRTRRFHRGDFSGRWRPDRPRLQHDCEVSPGRRFDMATPDLDRIIDPRVSDEDVLQMLFPLGMRSYWDFVYDGI